MTEAAQRISAAVELWRRSGPDPLVVAIDGHGAAGKTTLAGELASLLDAALVHTDDYFRERPDVDDPHPMARYYDWSALRREGLEPSIARLAVVGHGRPGVVLLEGVSSGAPAIADLVSRAVFVRTPEPVRLARLHGRVSDEEWDEAWLEAERAYFASRPPETFDLVVSGDAGTSGGAPETC